MYGAVRGLVTIPGLLGILAFFSREVPEMYQMERGQRRGGAGLFCDSLCSTVLLLCFCAAELE